ncbi:MAG: nucleotidyl transferase AbiEii/AbiGii toxin family protein [Candidatus Melainabacteria bacterium]|nr:nucleotidyl transferase AbiEii/AbiGii toxin family protein [Candidatus Melainabacteria bacterium]
MLDLIEINKLSKDIGIAALNIIREHIEVEILESLSKSKLSERIIFYGGTAIRLVYNGPRFSEDLDFIFKHQGKKDAKELESVLKTVSKNNEGVSIEEVHEKRNTLFGLIHVSNQILKHPIRIKIEISKKLHKQESGYLIINSPCSILNPIIKTSSLKNLIQNKLLAIKNRNEPRDWFDLWFLAKKNNTVDKPKIFFPFNKKEFENELKRWLPKGFWKAIPGVITYYEEN